MTPIGFERALDNLPPCYVGWQAEDVESVGTLDLNFRDYEVLDMDPAAGWSLPSAPEQYETCVFLEVQPEPGADCTWIEVYGFGHSYHERDHGIPKTKDLRPLWKRILHLVEIEEVDPTSVTQIVFVQHGHRRRRNFLRITWVEPQDHRELGRALETKRELNSEPVEVVLGLFGRIYRNEYPEDTYL